MRDGDGSVALIQRRRAFQVMLMIDGMFIAMHVVMHWFDSYGDGTLRSHTLLNLDREISIPTWWQQSQLVLAATLCLLLSTIFTRDHGRKDPYWFTLACIFLFISIDEGSEIHEYMTEPMRSAFDISGGLLWFAWLIPGALALAIFGLVFFRWWHRLPAWPRALMAIGGITFVMGAVGFEMVGGAHKADHGEDFGYFLIAAFEEGLEMIGATTFVLSLFTLVKQSQSAGGVKISIDE